MTTSQQFAHVFLTLLGIFTILLSIYAVTVITPILGFGASALWFVTAMVGLIVIAFAHHQYRPRIARRINQ